MLVDDVMDGYLVVFLERVDQSVVFFIKLS